MTVDNQAMLDPYQESIISNDTIKYHLKPSSNVLETTLTFPTVSSSNATINVYPPSADTLIAADPELEFTINLINTTTADDGTFVDNVIALRSDPVNKAIELINLGVNGVYTSCNSGDYSNAFTYLHSDDEFRGTVTCPMQNDPVSFYTKSPHGAPFSPFADYGLRTTIEPSRASWPDTQPPSTGTGPYTLTRSYTVRGKLLHGLLENGDTERAFTNVRELILNIKWASNLVSSLFSFNPGNLAGGALTPVSGGTGSVLTCSITDAKLHVRYITPSIQVPPQLIVPYTSYELRVSPLGAINVADAAKAFSLQSVVLGMVPSKIVLFVNNAKNVRQSDTGAYFANGFLDIDSVSIQWGTRSGLLANCSKQQLYAMSVRNGLNTMNFPQWTKWLGSIVVIDVAKDLGGITPGAIGNNQINITLTLRNTQYTKAGDTGDSDNAANANNTGRTYEANAIFFMDGHCVISPNTMNIVLGNQPDEILETDEKVKRAVEAEQAPEGSMEKVAGSGLMGSYYEHYHKGRRYHTLNGGKFNFHKVLGVAKDVLNVGTDVANGVANAAASMGYSHPMVKQGLSGLNALRNYSQGTGMLY